MQRDAPDLPEILRSVREFIDDLTSRLAGQDRYHALCASYLLSIGERELALGPAFDAEEAVIFADLAQDAATLSARLRSGALDERWDDLTARVLAHVVNNVRISRPDQLHPMHAAQAETGAGS